MKPVTQFRQLISASALLVIAIGLAGQPVVRPVRGPANAPQAPLPAPVSGSRLLFLAAVVASAALLLGQGVLGALAGSSLILAMLGFAIRNVVADTLSGVALGIEGPYRIGDWIDIEQVARGRVIEIGWRTTRILAPGSTYMILPNSQIARRRITNYSAPKPQYRAQLSLKLTHELRVDTAKALILRAMREARLIQTNPVPDVRAQELGNDGNC